MVAALPQKDLIHETSTTVGTIAFTTVAVNGKVRFGDSTYGFGTTAVSDQFDYYISNRDAAEWERGTGHASALGTLVRDTIIASSNANSVVSFSAGTKDITNDVPAALQVRKAAFPGCCLLTKNGSNLQLARKYGASLFINGNIETVPSTPITLSTSGLSASTFYYIYAYMSSGVMTLEASATGKATDSTYGHTIKSGDGTRSLVGIARTNGSTAWSDSASDRAVRSYFNRQQVDGRTFLTAQRTVTGTTFVEIHSELRLGFVIFDDDAITASFNPTGFAGATSGDILAASLGWDGTLEDVSSWGTAESTAQPYVGASVIATTSGATLGEGYHYVTGFGRASADAATYEGNASVNSGTTRRSTMFIRM